MARKWVSGLKNGQTYYLNLETNEETFIKPRNFDEEQAEGRSLAAAAAAAAAPADQQECTDQAASNAKAQLDSGVITQEEYDIIMAKIQAGQEVDDIDQFLNDTPSAKKHAKESLPAELTSDPDLVITDLTTGKKVHIVAANDELPVHKYDTFDSLYVIDKDTGRRTFLSDVQVEQFDTFRETEKKLGARAGAAKLHRKAKELRDSAPVELRVKLINALRDLDQKLQTPSGQRVLVGESPYFGGSLIKTRAAMVMAVQVQLKQVWMKAAGQTGGGKGGSGGKGPSSEDLMSLPEFVEVLQLMGFNATVESAAEVVARWGQGREDGLIPFRQFLRWCDLESCFVRTGSLAEDQLDDEPAGAEAALAAQSKQADDEFEDDAFADDVLDEALADPAKEERIQDLRDDLAEAEGTLKSGKLSEEEARYWRARAEDIRAELAALTGDWDNGAQSSGAAQLVMELVNTIEVGAGNDAADDSGDDDGEEEESGNGNGRESVSNQDAQQTSTSSHSNEVQSASGRAAVAEAISSAVEAVRQEDQDGGFAADEAASRANELRVTPRGRKRNTAKSSGSESATSSPRLSGKAAATVAPKSVDSGSSTSSPRLSKHDASRVVPAEGEGDEEAKKAKKDKKKKKRKGRKSGRRSRIKTVNLKPVDVVKVLYKFDATEDSELSINVGQVLTIYKQDDSGWWYAKDDDDNEGFVPFNYVKSIKDDPDQVADGAF